MDKNGKYIFINLLNYASDVILLIKSFGTGYVSVSLNGMIYNYKEVVAKSLVGV